MKKIRNNAFETNSSSTHSIIVGENKNGEYDILPIEEKLAYMIRCLVCYDFNEKNLQDKIKPIQERLHNLGIDFELPTYKEYKSGFVDHEDWYQEEIEDIYKDDNNLLNFLLSDYSYIEGGNDN